MTGMIGAPKFLLLMFLLIHSRCCEGHGYGDPFTGRSYRYANDFGWLGHHESRNVVMASTLATSSSARKSRSNKKHTRENSQANVSNRMSNGQVTEKNPEDMTLEVSFIFEFIVSYFKLKCGLKYCSNKK